MDMVKKLYQATGKTILLGNLAIIRGALEAGVQFVSVYPGTPASEIGDTFSLLSKAGKKDFYFEYSTNEKAIRVSGVTDASTPVQINTLFDMTIDVT